MTGLFVPDGRDHASVLRLTTSPTVSLLWFSKCFLFKKLKEVKSDSSLGHHPSSKHERNLQKKRDVVDKEFDPEEKDKGGGRHFFPAVWSNFANLGVVFYKEKLII